MVEELSKEVPLVVLPLARLGFLALCSLQAFLEARIAWECADL